jgi:hypothetical protein
LLLRRFLSPGLRVPEHTGKLALRLQEAVLGHLHPGAEPGEENPDGDEGGHEEGDGQNDEVDGHGAPSCQGDGDAGW